jgi:hypothetical protein
VVVDRLRVQDQTVEDNSIKWLCASGHIGAVAGPPSMDLVQMCPDTVAAFTNDPYVGLIGPRSDHMFQLGGVEQDTFQEPVCVTGSGWVAKGCLEQGRFRVSRG